MACEFKARLVLVHAIPALEFDPGTRYSETDFRKLLVSQATEQVSAMAQQCGVVDADMHIDGGTVANVVWSAAETYKADLVVVGRPTKTGIAGRLQTHTYSIIRDSPCPVVSL